MSGQHAPAIDPNAAAHGSKNLAFVDHAVVGDGVNLFWWVVLGQRQLLGVEEQHGLPAGDGVQIASVEQRCNDC